MPDIIVTTPKSRMAEAAREAEEAKAAGGGYYYRDFKTGKVPDVRASDRVYYVEDGYVRGYCLVDRVIISSSNGKRAARVYMDVKTWAWVDPIPMRGFQGFRYAQKAGVRRDAIREVGNWRIPRPKICSFCGMIYWKKCPNQCG